VLAIKLQTRRIHPAGKSHLGHVGRWVAGLELVAELDEIALSLALSSASRSFSLSICEISISLSS
jgi:hypothetical protein